jgi:hypothetical protein
VAHEGLKRATAGISAVALVACAPAAAPPAHAPRPAAARPAPAPGAFADRDWGVVESQRFLLAVPVPEIGAWTVDDRSGRWLVASHRPSQSILLLRSWREGAVVDHRACESAARSWRPDLFGRDESQLVDRRSVTAPPHFDTEVGFTVRRDAGVLSAIAAAVGANVRRCIALVFVTRVEGPDAEHAAAERLVFATTRILSHVESRSIEDRVREQR